MKTTPKQKTGKNASLNPAQKFLIESVKLYQKTLSPDHSFWTKNHPPYCKFFPTCSQYMIDAVNEK